CTPSPPDPHPFPTRRSSDLISPPTATKWFRANSFPKRAPSAPARSRQYPQVQSSHRVASYRGLKLRQGALGATLVNQHLHRSRRSEERRVGKELRSGCCRED